MEHKGNGAREAFSQSTVTVHSSPVLSVIVIFRESPFFNFSF